MTSDGAVDIRIVHLADGHMLIQAPGQDTVQLLLRYVAAYAPTQ
jgi:hypothetical protein